MQGGLTVRHKAHNLEIGGSIPPPARSFKDTSYRSLILSANPFSLPMTSTMTIQFECLILDKGLSKESINQQHTAGTFGRVVCRSEWYFWNVPLFSISIERKPSKIAHLMAFFTAKNLWEMSSFYRAQIPINLTTSNLYNKNIPPRNLQTKPIRNLR